jgi:hypothetical protein
MGILIWVFAAKTVKAQDERLTGSQNRRSRELDEGTPERRTLAPLGELLRSAIEDVDVPNASMGLCLDRRSLFGLAEEIVMDIL